jgi:hypothetical protein
MKTAVLAGRLAWLRALVAWHAEGTTVLEFINGIARPRAQGGQS